MKIRVIGSGSMWNEYNSASYMIDNNIIVDVPNGMCKNLFRMGINPNRIEHVLLTHFHGDHYFDMPFYMLYKSRAENKKIHIYCSEEGEQKVNDLLYLAFPNSKEAIIESTNPEYCFNEDFRINNYLVSKQLVDHGRMKPAYGYVFSFDDKMVGFTGDTTLCDSVEDMASKCNYLFCDCMFIEGTAKHMGINYLKQLISKYPNCIFVVSHLEKSTRIELKNLNLANVIVPEDGLVIEA